MSDAAARNGHVGATIEIGADGRARAWNTQAAELFGPIAGSVGEHVARLLAPTGDRGVLRIHRDGLTIQVDCRVVPGSSSDGRSGGRTVLARVGSAVALVDGPMLASRDELLRRIDALVEIADGLSLVVVATLAPLGDVAALSLCERIRGVVRSTELLARIGPAELAVILKTASPSVAQGVAARLTERLREPMAVDGGLVAFQARVGWAMARPTDTSVALLDRAVASARGQLPTPVPSGAALASAP